MNDPVETVPGTTWRAFLGEWGVRDSNPDRAWVDESGLTWEQARSQIERHLREFATDQCAACRGTAAQELARLKGLQPETEFFGEVDGEDYVIVWG